MIENKGDDNAHQLKPSAIFQGRIQTAPLVATLPPGGRERLHFRFAPRPLRTGRYPIRIALRYEDAMGHPFSVFLIALCESGTVPPPQIQSSFSSVSLIREGTAVLTAHNPTTQPKELLIQFLAVPEIAMTPAQIRKSLNPRKK